MRFPIPNLILLSQACLLLLGGASASLAAPRDSFPEGSAENEALLAAAEFLADEDFSIRQDYWKGDLTLEKGKAIRLQLFKKGDYRFFFAGTPKKLPPGAKLHLKIVDKSSEVVASASSEPSAPVAVLHFIPEKTELYLVLMRIEGKGNENADIPCVLFYGYR